MNVKILGKKAGAVIADVVAIGVREKHETGGAVEHLPQPLRSVVTARARRTHFKGKVGATLTVQGEDGDVVLVGVGDGSTSEQWRRAASAARGAAASARAATLALALDEAQRPADVLTAALEGLLLAGYSFEKYRTEKKDAYRGPKTLILSAPSLKDDAHHRGNVRRTETVCDAVAMARDLVNEMSTVKTPSYLAAVARTLARRGRVRCQVWQGARLRSEKMHGILAVSAGSRNPGALIKLVYTPRRRARGRIAIVGKGITFDSGGLSLKQAKSMETMKMDMSGAAIVLALMKALPELDLSLEVHGFIAAAENMPGQGAQKPGDVIRYRNGVTVEVLNTDAEGRLVLGDALCLASETEPDCIIDAATLTGACMVALGTRVGGILGTDQELVEQIVACGKEAGEQLWQLPLIEDYVEDIRSSVADIKNVGGGYAGTISAALFLRNFVGKHKWAHLDIAGPAFTERALPYTPKGGTGFALRTLLAYLESVG